MASVVDYSSWRPQTDTTLDLRLRSCNDVANEDAFLAGKAAEMGEKLRTIETQGSFISKDGLAALRDKCPKIEKLNLCCAHAVGDAALEVISRCENLTDLNLNSARNDEAQLQFLSHHICRVSPQNLDKVQKITDDGVEKVLKGCRNLQTLDLSGTQITGRTLALINSESRITFLRIYSCWNLNKEEIEAFKQQARPTLQIATDDTGATGEYQKLKQGVKGRFYQETKISNGCFKIGFQDGVDERVKPFINPAVFVNG